jgi:hypothetical protein
MEKVIKEMQGALRAHLGDWEEDGSSPANLVRKDGMGQEIARVDRWCGGYQSPHEPIIIGWRVRRGSSLREGVVEVGDFMSGKSSERGERDHDIKLGDGVAKAMAEAKRAAYGEYKILYGKEGL